MKPKCQHNANLPKLLSVKWNALFIPTSVSLCCSGGMPSNRITPEFSKWVSDGKLGQNVSLAERCVKDYCS